MNVTAKELSNEMEDCFHSRSFIAAIENGLRQPDANFVAGYIRALQKLTGFKGSILIIVQECLKDPEFMKLLTQYEKREGGFYTIFNLSQKIRELDISLSHTNND